jgi:hypothetical protein
MIGNTKFAFDDLLNTPQRPAFGGKADCTSPALQQPLQGALLGGGQFRRTPRRDPPALSSWCAHCVTAVRLTPRRRAISTCDNLPAFSHCAPFKRRSSICSRVRCSGVHVITRDCKPIYPKLSSWRFVARIIVHHRHVQLNSRHSLVRTWPI